VVMTVRAMSLAVLATINTTDSWDSEKSESFFPTLRNNTTMEDNMLPLFMDDCNACGALEERVFTDSWTGRELCAECLGTIINEVTNSPCSEGDNLDKLLVEHGLLDEDELDSEDGMIFFPGFGAVSS
jgi:hypothetical protein